MRRRVQPAIVVPVAIMLLALLPQLAAAQVSTATGCGKF
jgi:hypothetical protein